MGDTMRTTREPEFLNYFNEGFTSAAVEGLNNAIRGTIRRAYGYHVFENFRLHAMVEHGALPGFSH